MKPQSVAVQTPIMSEWKKNQARFIVWLRAKYPGMYRDVVKPDINAASQKLAGLSGLSDIFASIGNAASGIVNSVVSQADKIASAYVQTEQQKQLIKLNAQRAQQGLAPLDENGNPYPASFYDRAADSLSTGNVLMFAGLGLAGVLLLGVLLRKR